MASLTDNAILPSDLVDTLHGAHNDGMCKPEPRFLCICCRVKWQNTLWQNMLWTRNVIVAHIVSAVSTSLEQHHGRIYQITIQLFMQESIPLCHQLSVHLRPLSVCH